MVSPWKVSSACLAVLVLIFALKPNILGYFIYPNKEAIAKRCIEYINANLVQPGTEAKLVRVEEVSGVYRIVTEYLGQEIPVYATKDGNLLFISALNLTQSVERKEFDAPDSDRPGVDLFVMSFCPYGNMAEDAMKPVVELLGKKAEFRVRYIVGLSQEQETNAFEIQGSKGKYYVSSLHGTNEAWADAVEACIQKHYPQSFWEFLVRMNERCTPVYRDLGKLNECWNGIAKELKIDSSKVEQCAKGDEALQMLAEDSKLAEQWKVRGSPTLIINGASYDGPRTPEAFKRAVCSGFSKPPAECKQELAGVAEAPQGRC